MKSQEEEILNPIKVFEQLFQCHISLHDYTGFMKKNMRRLNYIHLNNFCAIQKKYHEKACKNFDRNAVENELFNRQKPIFKRCHAGVVELVLPVFIKEKLYGAMFVGPFNITEKDRNILHIIAKPVARAAASKLRATPDIIPEFDIEKIKAMKCFAELIVKNLERYVSCLNTTEPNSLDRRERIKIFIDNNFTKKILLDDLARHMMLSVPRISQLLKKYFDKGISTLVMEAKIRHAEKLLSNSFLTVEVIGYSCGFSSPSYFFRAFRKTHDCTPCEFRKFFLSKINSDNLKTSLSSSPDLF